MGKSTKVKLTVDLTRYAQGLTAGTEGYTVENQGMWSRGSDRFVTVNFPGIATLDVLWESLKIIDEEVLKEIEINRQIFIENLKTAHDVKLYLGPRGGFRHLSYRYIDKETGIPGSISHGFKEKAYEIMQVLEEYSIPIEEIIMK